MKNSLLSKTLYKSYHKSCKSLFKCLREYECSYGYLLGELDGLHSIALFSKEYKLADYIDNHNEKLIARYKRIMGK